MINLKGTVPIKGYLLKYIDIKENLNGGALSLIDGGVISFMLKILLTGKTNIRHEEPISTNTISKYDARLYFEVNARAEQFNQFFISRKNIVVFNSFVHQLFHEDLLLSIEKGEQEHKQIKDVIFDFCDAHNIEIDVDISFQALKKASYRLKCAKKPLKKLTG